jgi:hypothetical protein
MNRLRDLRKDPRRFLNILHTKRARKPRKNVYTLHVDTTGSQEDEKQEKVKIMYSPCSAFS